MNDLYRRLEFDKVLEDIANHASFSLSKKNILETEMNRSLLMAKRDLNRLEDAMRLLEEGLSFSFSGVSDITYSLQRAAKSALLSVEEIVSISRFLQAVKRIQYEYLKLEENYDYLSDLFESLDYHPDLLDFLLHSFSEQGEVLDRASSLLQNIRRAIKRLEEEIEKQSSEFLKKNADLLSEQVVSIQEGRATFLIKASEKNKLPGTIYGQSATGQSFYFEPAFLSKMQNELHGLKLQENEEIQRICLEASLYISKEADQILANLETMTLLDVIFAKAIWGRKHEAVVPSLTEDRLYLEKARHPLIDPKEVVPNTYRLERPKKCIIISGPNTGGKSVTLKTIALSVLLSLSGAPVLAESAEVFMVDNIFVDIGDEQSIEKSLSSFSAHLTSMKTIMDQATDKSLILLDELGSQTDPLEGESLAMSFIDYFRELDAWLIATTHFSKLKKYGAKHEDVLIASVEFDLESLRPTYKYKENVFGESYALSIAQRYGIDNSVLEKAKAYKKESSFEEDHLLEILEKKIQEQEQIKEQLKRQERRLKEAEKQVIDQEKTLKKTYLQKEKELENKYQEEVQKIIDSAREELDKINREHRPNFRQESFKKIESLQEEVLVEESFELGDKVRIRDTHQIGVLESIDGKDAQIVIGAMTLSVKLSKLEKVKIAKKKSQARSHVVKAQRSQNPELNLLGLRVDEAKRRLDKFIDQAILSHLNSVRIIHGFGTGALRKAVHESLRKHKSVKSFEFASPSEGGNGVTVVNLK